MVELVFPEPDFKIREQNGRPELFDVIRSKWVALGPEEWVRQNFIQWMVKNHRFPLAAIAVEKKLKLGLLGTAIEAQFQLIKQNRPEKVFIVPLVLSTHFVLEAASLIESYLAQIGKHRFVLLKDESWFILKVFRFI